MRSLRGKDKKTGARLHVVTVGPKVRFRGELIVSTGSAGAQGGRSTYDDSHRNMRRRRRGFWLSWLMGPRAQAPTSLAPACYLSCRACRELWTWLSLTVALWGPAAMSTDTCRSRHSASLQVEVARFDKSTARLLRPGWRWNSQTAWPARKSRQVVKWEAVWLVRILSHDVAMHPIPSPLAAPS